MHIIYNSRPPPAHDSPTAKPDGRGLEPLPPRRDQRRHVPHRAGSDAARQGRPSDPVRQHGERDRGADGPGGPPVPPEGAEDPLPPLLAAELEDLAAKEVGADLEALGGAAAGGAGRLEDAILGDAAAPRGQGLWRVGGEQAGRVGDDGVCAEGLGQLGEDGVEDLRLGGGEGEELCAAADDDLCEYVDGEDGLGGEQGVEEAGYLAEGLDVVGVHGHRAREGEEGLRPREVRRQGRVGGADDVRDQAQLGDGRGEVGEHEVADAQGREPGHGGRAEVRGQDQEEDLAYVVVALEVAQVRVPPQDGEDEVRQLLLLAGKLLVGFVCGGVRLC